MLPNLPYRGGKVFGQLLNFKGINLSDNYADGEFSDSSNLSTLQYPCITQRRKMSVLKRTVPGTPPTETDYVSPTDIFEWDGKLIVVDGGTIYYENTPIDNVSPGHKQFAVVNTHLIVWPDKLDIDLTNGSFTRMDAACEVTAASFTANTINASLTPILDSDVSITPSFGGDASAWSPLVYTYGTDMTAISWDSVTGWSHPTPVIKSVWSYSGSPYSVLSVGDILIPQISGGSLHITSGTISSEGTVLPTETENEEGKFCVYSRMAGEVSIYGSHVTLVSDVYYAGADNILFSSKFSVGDRLKVYSGDTTLCRFAKVTAFDDVTNTITFGGTPFTLPVSGTEWTVQREIPDIDYICESNNRLWGVSNAVDNINADGEHFYGRVIYASALGMPTHFWDFDGTDMDSYQVSVGSEGNFTGIVNYNGVNCFKEKKLHRVFGDYPSEYYIGEYDIPGIASGCSRSTQIINEVLYYVGIYGVYAYNGNTPTMISYKLGSPRLLNAVAGNDGERLYIYAERNGDGLLFTYDTLHGLWLKDSINGVDGFCSVGGQLYICANGEIKYFSDLSAESFDWSVTFTPFFANVSANASTVSSFNRKNFTKLNIRADMQIGSVMNVYVKYDNGSWQKVYTKEADDSVTIKVPIPISRCDRIQIKLDGTNGVKILGLEREYARASHE